MGRALINAIWQYLSRLIAAGFITGSASVVVVHAQSNSHGSDGGGQASQFVEHPGSGGNANTAAMIQMGLNAIIGIIEQSQNTDSGSETMMDRIEIGRKRQDLINRQITVDIGILKAAQSPAGCSTIHFPNIKQQCLDRLKLIQQAEADARQEKARRARLAAVPEENGRKLFAGMVPLHPKKGKKDEKGGKPSSAAQQLEHEKAVTDAAYTWAENNCDAVGLVGVCKEPGRILDKAGVGAAGVAASKKLKAGQFVDVKPATGQTPGFVDVTPKGSQQADGAEKTLAIDKETGMTADQCVTASSTTRESMTYDGEFCMKRVGKYCYDQRVVVTFSNSCNRFVKGRVIFDGKDGFATVYPKGKGDESCIKVNGRERNPARSCAFIRFEAQF